MIQERKQLFPIGIGTYGLGAARYEGKEKNPQVDISDTTKDAQSLHLAFQLGLNYIETSYSYAAGQTMEFLGKIFKTVPRDQLFITVKLEKYVEKLPDVQQQLDRYLHVMGLDYADSLLLHSPRFTTLPLLDVYAEMQKQVTSGKARFLSTSNLSFPQLQQLVGQGGYHLFSFEGLFNLECKVNEDVGIIQFCHDHGIIFVCFQPLRRNRTAARNYPLLVELAAKYHKTQNQILLNWIIKEKKLLPLVKCSNAEHLKENIASIGFEIERDDILRLNTFRSTEFDSLVVDWAGGNGLSIAGFANQFP